MKHRKQVVFSNPILGQRLEKRLEKVCPIDKGQDCKGWGWVLHKSGSTGPVSEKLCIPALIFVAPTSSLQPGQMKHALSNICVCVCLMLSLQTIRLKNSRPLLGFLQKLVGDHSSVFYSSPPTPSSSSSELSQRA